MIASKEQSLSPIQSLSKGTHEFYIPDIREWNAFVQYIRSLHDGSAQFSGSVEDLVTGNCKSCDGELIRVMEATTRVFNGGIIYCPSTDGSKNHPHQYWVEVWPDANWHYKKPYSAKTKAEIYEGIANNFRLSDSRIKKCFNNIDIQLGLPDPRFVHP